MALAAGFIPSALFITSAARFVGSALGSSLIPPTAKDIVALVAGGAALMIDARVIRRGSTCSVGLSRQTHKSYMATYGHVRGPYLWGVDTGLAVTTVRVTAATWLLLALVLLGLAPWWTGLSYGLAFSLSVFVAAAIPPWRAQVTYPEPAWLLTTLAAARRPTQFLTVGVLAGTTATCAILAVGR